MGKKQCKQELGKTRAQPRTEDSARELRPSWDDETTADTTCMATAVAAPPATGAPCASTEHNNDMNGAEAHSVSATSTALHAALFCGPYRRSKRSVQL